MNATPRPWEAVASMESNGAVDIIADRESGADSFPAVIATVYGNEGEPSVENAALIVHAVNTHERAKDVLQEVANYFEGYAPESRTAKIVENHVKALLADMEG